MRAARLAVASQPSKRRSTKRVDKGVPFDEMRRLMRVYGSIKCLRKRKGRGKGEGGSGEDAKIESVKRKFYRWFPDFEERFERVAPGEWRPRFGHEVEMRYRAERRREDGEILVQKRSRCRGKRKHKRCRTAEVPDKSDAVNESPMVVKPLEDAREVDADSAPPKPAVWPAVSADPCPSTMAKARRVTSSLQAELPSLPPDLLGDGLGQLDQSQLELPTDGRRGVFDEVEDSFYGTGAPDGGADALAGPSSRGDALSQLLERWTGNGGWTGDGPGNIAAPDMSRAVTDGLTRIAEALSRSTSVTDVASSHDASSSSNGVSSASPPSSRHCWEDAPWELSCEDGGDPFGEPIEEAIEGRVSILDDLALSDIDDSGNGFSV